MKMFYFVIFISFIFSVFFSWLVKKMALKLKILDYPSSGRKIHKRPIPLMGGLAVFLTLVLVLGGLYLYNPQLVLGKHFFLKNLIGLFIGGAILMFGGFLDDKYNLKPSRQIVWPILAVIIVIAAGIGIPRITNPFGGMLDLARFEWILFWRHGIAYKITLLADIFTFLWLMGMMYTTKFLDGLDGLVAGISAIGAFIIFIVSLLQGQPETALLSLVFAGACLGFLIFNWHPAGIFLGEGGSLFLGFMLGSLAIISGSKVAATLLIVGIPVLDVLWTIIRRVFIEKTSPFKGDRKHFHHRLLDAGFSHRGAVLLLYFLTASFGASSLFLQTKQRLIAFLILTLVMLVLGTIVATRTHLIKEKPNK